LKRPSKTRTVGKIGIKIPKNLRDFSMAAKKGGPEKEGAGVFTAY